MKKILNKLLAPVVVTSLVVPTICISTTSCANNHVEIQSIKLSSRYSYIYPGEELKIKAKVYPSAASEDDLIWEINESSIPGFTISDNGKLCAPEEYPDNNSVSITIKATSKTNPNVFALYSVLATTDTEHEFLGFAGGVNYLGRDGSVQTRAILNENVNLYGYDMRMYYLEDTYWTVDDEHPLADQDGINLYAGRSGEYVDFRPVFKTGDDVGMEFFLLNSYGYDTEYNCCSWVGYSDGTVTDQIPQFQTNTPVYRKQIMEVNFTADEYVVFRIVCDVYQNTNLNTAAIFGYNPDPEGTQSEDEHSIIPYEDGVYQTQILCPLSGYDVAKQKRISDIYLYRKPYEDIDETLKARWEPNEDAPDIFTKNGKPAFTELDFDHHLPGFDEYQIAKFSATYTVDPAKLVGMDYDNYLIGTYFCYDVLDTNWEAPVARLDFVVQWII
ncbi:MAG: hypothetical protein KBS35_01890 [Mycoplasma sp.]|nr:hypothetical protein [Candidatus Hennigella equi]